MRKILSLIFTTFLLLLLTACGSNSDDVVEEEETINLFTATSTYLVTLSGSQQVPFNASPQTATALIEIDEDDLLVRATLNVSDVTGFSVAHIHAGGIGVNGNVVIPFSGDSSILEIAPTGVSSDQLQNLLDGSWYVNLHTADFPAGEIRGQIVPSSVVIVSFPLSGSQEVPAVTTSASGMAYASYDSASTALRVRVNTEGVDDATMAHVHTGRIGMNGPVLLGLDAASDMGAWESPAGATLDADTFAVLASGGHYVNVHTPANPGGELRGQITTDNFVLATFPLQGSQEVPAVTTMAAGSGYALIDSSTFSVELVAVTSGVADATMAHIHTGRIGMNGPVLVGLEQSMDDANVWVTPADLAIDADTFAVLASGGHYVNVHSPANPSGELRGQITTDNFVLATFPLQGSQEVPAITTMARGWGYALVDSTTFTLELRALTEGVDDATMAHIHTGRIGMNGPVLVGLERSQDNPSMWITQADLTIDADTFAVLASGGHYVNVHTPANPSGELRGQITTDNFVLATFPLQGSQEVPAVTTMGKGWGYALIDSYTFSVELVAVTSGVADATMAHIHTGRIGMNGPVLVGLEQSMDDANVWVTPADLAIDADTFAVLASGGHYVNVHTPANPSGELRGQITTDNFVLVAFPLSGTQEIPAVVTDAFGSGYALVNTYSFSLELIVLTSGVDDATMAHIHTGPAGTNGPVLVWLEQAEGSVNMWMNPMDLTIDADIFAVLAGGGHYVNVHTPANPGGEIRGQIQ